MHMPTQTPEKGDRAKVFMTGRSQAVRIPAAYRFATDEVHIRRNEQGDIVLSPVRKKRSWEEIFKLFEEVEEDANDFLLDRDQGESPDRPDW